MTDDTSHPPTISYEIDFNAGGPRHVRIALPDGVAQLEDEERKALIADYLVKYMDTKFPREGGWHAPKILWHTDDNSPVYAPITEATVTITQIT